MTAADAIDCVAPSPARLFTKSRRSIVLRIVRPSEMHHEDTKKHEEHEEDNATI